MTRPFQPIAVQHRYLPLIAVMVGAILAFDLLTPGVFLAPMLYILPVLMAVWSQPRRAAYGVAIICTIAVLVGLGVSAASNHSALPTPNYFCALILIWAAVVIALQRQRMVASLKQARDRLEVEVAERTADLSEANQHLQKEIAERQRAEDELSRSNWELEQFAYVAAHDLKQPVRTVKMFLDLLDNRSRSELNAQGQEFLGYALSGAQRMDALIEDLLKLAKVSHNERSMEKICLQCVVDEVLANLQAEIQETGAMITHDDLPDVIADRSQLSQLLQNLIGNAIKYRGDRQPRIHVGIDTNEEEFHFSVQDNGVGIDPRHSDKVFEVFRRLHTDSEAPGTGIGLALCQRIVDSHGGRIWVDSQPGQGSTFHFTLPNDEA